MRIAYCVNCVPLSFRAQFPPVIPSAARNLSCVGGRFLTPLGIRNDNFATPCHSERSSHLSFRAQRGIFHAQAEDSSPLWGFGMTISPPPVIPSAASLVIPSAARNLSRAGGRFLTPPGIRNDNCTAPCHSERSEESFVCRWKIPHPVGVRNDNLTVAYCVLRKLCTLGGSPGGGAPEGVGVGAPPPPDHQQPPLLTCVVPQGQEAAHWLPLALQLTTWRAGGESHWQVPNPPLEQSSTTTHDTLLFSVQEQLRGLSSQRIEPLHT